MTENPFDIGPHGPAPAPDRPADHPQPESSGTGRSAIVDRHDDGEVHLLDYMRVLHKRRWVASTIFLIVVVSVVIYCFTATPIYEARARVLIETENPNVVSFKTVVDEDQGKQDYYQTQYNILQSRTIVRRTLEELMLWNSPPFGGVTEEPTLGRLTSAVTRWVAHLFAAQEKMPDRATPAVGETAKESAAVDVFLGALTVTPIRNSRLVDIKIALPDAALSARIVNAFAKNYIEQNLEYKFTASKEAGDWLRARMAEQRKEVETAEAKLQRYREQNDAISLKDRENIVVQKLSDLNGRSRRPRPIAFKRKRFTTSCRRCARHQARSTPSRPFSRTPSFSSRKPTSPGCRASTRSSATSSDPTIPTW